MPVIPLAERRALVIGASSGVGRDVADALAARGGRVAYAARRGELVEEAAGLAGGGCVGYACDVRDPDACRAVVERAVDDLGGLDTLVYGAAIGPLTDLRDASAEVWREALEINVIGASLVTAAAVDALERSGDGKALYLSSISGSTATPWPGLGVYTTSKAALDRLVDAWRIEHPALRFTSIALGPMASRNGAPGSFGAGWDPEKAGASVERWMGLGLMDGSQVDTADLCEQVLAILGVRSSISRVVVEP